MFRASKKPYTSLSTCAATVAVVLCALSLPVSSFPAPPQDKDKKKAEPSEQVSKEEGKVPNEKDLEKKKKSQEKLKGTETRLSTVETIAELTIIAYGGRKQLETVRAGIQEEGTIRLATDQGDLTGDFVLRSLRREKTWQDLLRVDLSLTPPGGEARQGAGVKYTIGYNGATVWSAQNNQYVTPRPEVEAAFRAQLTREYMALLRYKEDGSKVELVGPETVVGVDTNVIDLTNPNGEKTRYWISTRTYRILHAEYELKLADGPTSTKYRVSYFYTPFRVVQNTLVPIRRMMTQDGKFVQEINLTNITYSAKIDPEVFQHLQE
ncbi:MAG TPA: hypothetical protein VNI02_02710 [Blastocatellia bacterium]|nr:hypothetical protein [Blastocatellia bacterium]